jgi:hypothetical protein
MGRIRTIKPEFTQDEELSSLPAETHLLAAGLLCYSDDDGYFNSNHGLVKAAVFPLRETSVSIHDMLTQLANIGFVRLGTAADGKNYGQVVKFTEHQRVNRPTPSKINQLPIKWKESVSTHGSLTEGSLPEGKGKEGKGREENLLLEQNSSSVRGSRKKKNSTHGGCDPLAVRLYEIYPRKVGRAGALRATTKAIGRVQEEKKCSREDAADFLYAAVAKFAGSPAGNKGEYTPYCATWMNSDRFFDDPAEWWTSNGLESGAMTTPVSASAKTQALLAAEAGRAM